METLRPETPEALAEVLASAAREGRQIRTGGGFTKNAFAGPLAPAEVAVSTGALNRVVQYDPRDLTISVEAGLPYSELSRVLGENRQLLPLDPPLADTGTIGGVIASNLSGPRRRLYGTARDMVIGMKFATLEGKLVQTGGMVVKNVAGLDVAKLMIGSCGTLATLVAINFRVHSAPLATRTFLLSFDAAGDAARARDRVLKSVLQPAAVDLANPAAAARLGRSGFLLAVQAGGSAAVLGRYSRELEGAAAIESGQETDFWRRVRDFAPDYLAATPQGAVARVSTTLGEVATVLLGTAPVVARAGSGVSYVCFESAGEAAAWAGEAAGRGWKAVVEWAAPAARESLDLWPAPGGDIEVMKAVKRMFDPGNLLNKGRLYGRC
ncbi:MAG: FAD-binding oxidoreductase [Bryobacterales bacterium]|nr:FAD-binding oxidoreductase [Bryobacterales bacterium]